MKEAPVSEELRLIQVFLTQQQTPGPSIFEVSTDKDDNLYCTCAGFRGRSFCKHVKFVKARIETNGGTYPLEISTKASREDAEKAQESNSTFRNFVIKYGKIEVL
jgi:hypothetical protein